MTRILDGIHVVSLAPNLPGPLAANRLQRLGARVTKIEAPGGDPLAVAAPNWYTELTVGQQVIALDLKDLSARARLDDILATADLLITAVRPTALDRLGLADLDLSRN